jgi:hypothetical protein
LQDKERDESVISVYSGGDEMLQEFIDGKASFTIATNVVGRGVSSSGLNNVVIFDYPQSLVELQQTYMRAGLVFFVLSHYYYTFLTLSGQVTHTAKETLLLCSA